MHPFVLKTWQRKGSLENSKTHMYLIYEYYYCDPNQEIAFNNLMYNKKFPINPKLGF